MIQILKSLFAAMNDKTLCTVVTRVLQDTVESNHTIETIRKAWIPQCELHAGSEYKGYMREGDEDLLPVSEFSDVFFVLESMGTRESYVPPLQIDELFLDYCSRRYQELKSLVSKDEEFVPRNIEMECWLLQSNFSRLLIDEVAAVIRENAVEFSNLAAPLYWDVKRNMVAVDTQGIDSYFTTTQTESRKQREISERRKQADTHVDDQDIAGNLWDVGQLCPELRSYVTVALEANAKALKKYHDSDFLYLRLMETLKQPAGMVFEKDQSSINGFLQLLESVWDMHDSARNAQLLWNEWCKARLTGLEQQLAYDATKHAHKNFYDALAEERFIDRFVSQIVRPG